MDVFDGPINTLSGVFRMLTGEELSAITPDYIWDLESPKHKTINLIVDWIKENYPNKKNEIFDAWYKELKRSFPEPKISKERLIQHFTNKRNLAKQFLDYYPIHYNSAKIWWVWNHKKFSWEIQDEVDLLNKVDDNVERVDTIVNKEKTEIIEALRQEGRKRKPKEPGKNWIQFKDVLIDIKTEETIIATPEYFVTNPIPFKIGETEATPTMDKLFTEWVGKEYVDTLYEILAYCCLPDYPIHRIFCFIGSGCNGKSQFLKLLRKFIGESNCCSTELDTLLNSRFEKTRLYKKLVCQMGETNFNEMSQTSLLKKLSGGDLIGFEFKNKDPFESENYAKIIIATNTLPSTTDKTLGFYRRWMIIDFPNRFEETNGDIVDSIPEVEYNNLAKKSIQILKRLTTEYNFTNEGTIEERADKYEEKSNPFEKFWADRIVEDYDSYIFKFEFKKEFDSWCRNHGFRKLSDIEIKHKMDLKGIATARKEYISSDGETKRYNSWVGITFTTNKPKGIKEEDFDG